MLLLRPCSRLGTRLSTFSISIGLSRVLPQFFVLGSFFPNRVMKATLESRKMSGGKFRNVLPG